MGLRQDTHDSDSKSSVASADMGWACLTQCYTAAMVHLAPRGSRIRPGFLALVLLALLQALAAAQTVEPERPDPLTEPWRVKHYEELVGRGLHDLAEDSDGRLWFATGAGVASYDGLEWRSWTIVDGLLDERITSILALSDGSVVAGSRSGFSRFADGRWEALLGRHEGAIWGAAGGIALGLGASLIYAFTVEDEDEPPARASSSAGASEPIIFSVGGAF